MEKLILPSVSYSDILNFKKKRYARCAVNNAIKSGKLSRPSLCELCKEQSDFIEAHHCDYGSPLNVNWVCRPCHSRVHRDDHPLNPNNHPQTPFPFVESHYKNVTITFTLPVQQFLLVDRQAKRKNIAVSSLIKKEIENIFRTNNKQIEFNFEGCYDDTLQIKHA